jgi:hypothetical protein
MNNRKLNTYCSIVLIIVGLTLIPGCNKESKFNNNDLLGTWWSTDSIDYLDFKSETDLYKNWDHFNYSLFQDSITVQYSGVLYIYVKPTTHHYTLKGNELTIDFKPSCYGFRAREIKFIRK